MSIALKMGTIVASFVLLSGLVVSSGQSQPVSAAMTQEGDCFGCNVDNDGHHCFQVNQETEPGNTKCRVDNDPETGKQRCAFTGIFCGHATALLPSDGQLYLAATGSFAMRDRTMLPARGEDGYARICSGVIVGGGDESAPAPLTLAF